MAEIGITVTNVPDEPLYPLATARAAALDFMDQFKSVEMRNFEIAGSIRREKAMVKDIEIVAEPAPALTLFGDPAPDTYTEFDYTLAAVLQQSRYTREKGGDRYVRILDRWSGISIDLFIVRPPAQFGCMFTIRTGPGDFSKWLVTSQMKGGAMPSTYGSGIIQRDGALWEDIFGEPLKLIPTPTEESYFAALGLDWIPPRERRAMWRKR